MQYNLVTKSNKSHLESINRRRTHSNNNESVRRPTCSETNVAVDLVRANRRHNNFVLLVVAAIACGSAHGRRDEEIFDC
jgi:hypothetical protein